MDKEHGEKRGGERGHQENIVNHEIEIVVERESAICHDVNEEGEKREARRRTKLNESVE